jgi:HAD superfamily hydrolase (TIGR01456 family)
MFAPCRRVTAARFVPPWEKTGKGADAFFSGILRSANPLQRDARDEARHGAAVDRDELDAAHVDASDLRALDVAEGLMQEEMLRDAEAKEFLPYGAAPKKYFPASGMAAWGTYQAGVAGGALPEGQPASGGDAARREAFKGYTSDAARGLLAGDMASKLPYKYDALPAAPVWPLHGSCGVALDLDGVVHRSGQLIDGSELAVRHLNALKVPLCFMTNGGGDTEANKAARLADLLGAEVRPEQVILAHTPMQKLAPRYADAPVLIVGPPGSVAAAKAYGFAKAVSVAELQLEHPEWVPHKRWGSPADERRAARNKKRNVVDGDAPLCPEFAAVFFFNEVGIDAFNDIQIIVDILTSPFGCVGGAAVSAEQTVPFYMAADDLLFPGQAPLPRLAQGAFREMLGAVYESVTGRELQVTLYGKPRRVAFRYARDVLRRESARHGWDPDALRTACMVGDNLETDIVGANAMGAPWLSVHVLSGLGHSPSAVRSVAPNDAEAEWLLQHVPRAPHYVAPTLDHFVREMEHFGEAAVTLNRPAAFFPPPCPADLRGTYNFTDGV